MEVWRTNTGMSILVYLLGNRTGHAYRIAKELGHSKSYANVHSALKKLAEAGMVVGRLDRSNTRAPIVYTLTSKGKIIAESARVMLNTKSVIEEKHR